MTIRHHVDDELLVAFAAGDLPEAVALFVGSHAALCETCRSTILRWEDVGGEMFVGLEPVALDVSALASTLDRLDEPRPRSAEGPLRSAPRPRASDLLPLPLLEYARGSIDNLRWRRILPGVLQADLPVFYEGIPVRINRLSSFVRIPLHTHRAPEYTLILAGGFQDEHGTFERGDVLVYDAQDRHSQRVLPGGPCLCLVVNSDRLVPLTWLGRLLGRITGL
jgi:putative transcriptional regulator